MYSLLFRYSSMLKFWHWRLFTLISIVVEVRKRYTAMFTVCGPIPLFNGWRIALAKSMNLSTSRDSPKPRASNQFSYAMSLSSAYAAQSCARIVRASSRTNANAPLAITQRHRNRRAPSRRWESTASAPLSTNPKISTIVEQISQLTLLETADLVSNLKVSLQVCWIRDLAMPLQPFTGP